MRVRPRPDHVRPWDTLPRRRRNRARCGRGSSVLLAAVGACAVAVPAIAAPPEQCSQVLIVLDRTSSMLKTLVSGDVKWPVAVKAIKDFTTSYESSIRFGFLYYNGSSPKGADYGNACAPGKLVFDPKDRAAADVAAALDAVGPYGNTPTWETMLDLVGYRPLLDPRWKGHILLITDGSPNCQDNELTGEKSIATIAEVRKSGIPVYVLGFGIAGTSVNPAILDGMAEAGGTARAAPAPRKYYAADKPAEIKAALEEIASKVGGATVGGCVLGGDRDGGAGAGGGNGSGGDQGGRDGGQGGSDTGGNGAGTHGAPGCACRSVVSTAADAPLLAVVALAFAGAVSARRRRT